MIQQTRNQHSDKSPNNQDRQALGLPSNQFKKYEIMNNTKVFTHKKMIRNALLGVFTPAALYVVFMLMAPASRMHYLSQGVDVFWESMLKASNDVTPFLLPTAVIVFLILTFGDYWEVKGRETRLGKLFAYVSQTRFAKVIRESPIAQGVLAWLFVSGILSFLAIAFAMKGMPELSFWERLVAINYGSVLGPIYTIIGVLVFVACVSEKNSRRTSSLKERVANEGDDLDVTEVKFYTSHQITLEMKTAEGKYTESSKAPDAINQYLEILAKIKGKEVPEWIREDLKNSN